MMTRIRPKMSRYLMGITYMRGNPRTVEERRRSGIGLCRGEAAARREHQSVSNLDDRVSWRSGGGGVCGLPQWTVASGGLPQWTCSQWRTSTMNYSQRIAAGQRCRMAAHGLWRLPDLLASGQLCTQSAERRTVLECFNKKTGKTTSVFYITTLLLREIHFCNTSHSKSEMRHDTLLMTSLVYSIVI